jgi:beta-galactosidase
MYFGVAYYPEHWPEERWAVDAKMMQEAGINGVRMGEFAWSKIEPVEGEYDFEWLDRAVALLADFGIKTMMCTLSRTPPPWAFKYPGIRNTRADGHVSNYGHRYTVCLNDPTFIELSRRIDRAVIEHYAGNQHVIAWHIDNEIGAGNACFCQTCHRAFIEYLREKYGTTENLNDKWGAHFWSFSFSSFREVPLPTGVSFPSPSLALEYARFQSKVNVDFALWRYDLMKQLHPEAWVTTNFQTSRAVHTDIFDLGRATDVYGTNFYPPFAPEFALDYCRGAGDKLLILEQRSGQPHWMSATRPGWMRLWTYRSIAHGACGINFFRWRPCRWGQEEYWNGVLPHSGRPNRRYRELSQMGRELERIGDLIESTRPKAQVAIVMSYESRWALNAVLTPFADATRRSTFGREGMHVHEAAKAYHAALMEKNLCTDAMDPREDLSQYRLVIAPRLYSVDADVAENLCQFVKDGGVLCLTPRSGVVDEYNTIFERPAPGPLSEMAGVEVDDYGSLDKAVPLRANVDGLGDLLEGTTWADEIILSGAEPLVTYAQGWLADWPAITINEYGNGKVVYVGTVLRGETLNAFVSWLFELAGVTTGPKTPKGVRAYERQSDDLCLLFLLNFSETVRVVSLDGEWEDALTGKRSDEVELEPAGVNILKNRKS